MIAAHEGPPGADVEALRRCIGDIVGLSTLSAVWAGMPRPWMAESLAEVLRETLDVDLVYVALHASAGAAQCEGISRTTAAHEDLCHAIRVAISSWSADAAFDVSAVPRDVHHHLTPIGIGAEHGLVVTVGQRDGFPTRTERLLLNVAANQATLALLTDKARGEQRIADTLQRIGTLIAAELDPEKIIQTVTDEATALTGADFGAFFYNVTDSSGESYMLYTLSGAPREAFSRFPMPRNTAIFAPTFAGSSVVRLPDVTADPRFGHNPPYNGMPAGHLPVRSYLAVPVRSRTGKVHGGLFFGHQEVGTFTERHERLVVGIAAWAALAIDNGSLYAEAQRANAAKDHFLATLSHELRTPLNAITGWLSMLRRPEVMTASGLPKAWAAIDRNTAALTDLVEDLLDVSRIATGKVRLADAPVDLNEVVQDTTRTLEPQFAEKGVRLSVAPAPGGSVVRGDAARLRQVVSNLLSNALRFTPGDGRVAVTVTGDPATAILVVEDSGIGIHPGFLPHVFERFRQQEGESTAGLGLGLAIVKSLVELHGGSVTAESPGIGLGARFTITLPLMSARSTDA